MAAKIEARVGLKTELTEIMGVKEAIEVTVVAEVVLEFKATTEVTLVAAVAKVVLEFNGPTSWILKLEREWGACLGVVEGI